jgi:hypothetical protein
MILNYITSAVTITGSQTSAVLPAFVKYVPVISVDVR